MNYKLLFEMEVEAHKKTKEELKGVWHRCQTFETYNSIKTDKIKLLGLELEYLNKIILDAYEKIDELESKKSGEFKTKLQPTIIINNYI